MKATTLSIFVLVVLIGGIFLFSGGSKKQTSKAVQVQNSNVSIVGGKQIITINAKGGYSPRTTAAKADIPTVIRMNTQGTFDCSSAFTIPTLGINRNLPPSGQTEIEIPAQKSGTNLRGLCAMGMYNFSIDFN